MRLTRLRAESRGTPTAQRRQCQTSKKDKRRSRAERRSTQINLNKYNLVNPRSGWQIPNLITGLGGRWAPNYSLRTQEFISSKSPNYRPWHAFFPPPAWYSFFPPPEIISKITGEIARVQWGYHIEHVLWGYHIEQNAALHSCKSRDFFLFICGVFFEVNCHIFMNGHWMGTNWTLSNAYRYICICTCGCIHMYTYWYIYIYICTCVYIYIYIFIHILHVYTHTYTYTCINIYT